MTIREILRVLEPLKPMTAPGLYAHLRALKIKPVGVRQVPQNYPDDTADRVLTRLGLKHSNGRKRRSPSRRARRQLQREAA